MNEVMARGHSRAGEAAGTAHPLTQRGTAHPLGLLAAWIQPQCTQTVNISHHLSCLCSPFHSELVWVAAF